MRFQLDAHGTDGTRPELVDRVYEDGVRIPLSQPERDDDVTRDEAAARAAVANLQAYADLATPTNAQTVAVVKLLCRVVIAVVKRLMRGDT